MILDVCHRVPFIRGEVRDAVERVLTIPEGTLRGREPDGALRWYREDAALRSLILSLRANT